MPEKGTRNLLIISSGAYVFIVLLFTFTNPDQGVPPIVLLPISVLILLLFFFTLGRTEKSAKEALKETEETREYLQQVLDNIPTGVLLIDPEDHKIMDVNLKVSSLIATSREDILYTDCRKSQICKAKGICPITDMGKDSFDGELLLRKEDGTMVPALKNVRPVQLKGRKLLMECLTDLSPLKKIESELERERAFFKELFQNSPEGITVCDEQGKVVRANPAFCKMFDFQVEDVEGKSLLSLISTPEMESGMLSRLREVVSSNASMSIPEIERKRSDGSSLSVSVLKVPMEVAEGHRFDFVIYRDISEWKKIDRLKKEFVSTVSHELRTPLTSIHGSLGLLLGGVAGEISEEARGLLNITHKNSERLIGLVNDILDIEKIEANKMVFHFSPLDLKELAERAIELIRPYGEQFHVSFVLEDVNSEVYVRADRDRLLQVMTNLLSNAAKFSEAGSRVRLSLNKRNDMVRFSVRDNGPGIPEDFQGKIFSKFSQADSSDTRNKGGTGLGLSISKAIIEKHEGTIGFDTSPGKGSTFYFDLPEYRTVELSPKVVDAVAEIRTGDGDKPKVLVCEDDPDVATLIGYILAKLAVEPVIVHSAEEAKAKLKSGDYSAVTVDLMLPGHSGFSFLRDLRNDPDNSDLPAIVISAKAKEGKQEAEGMAFEVLDWIEKPINEVRLLAAVKKAVDGKSGATILHVEDDKDILHLVSMMVRDFAETCPAESLAEARQMVSSGRYDLVILDLMLPDGSGLDLLPDLRYRNGEPIPVVVFSALDITPEVASRVESSFVKSRSSYEELTEKVKNIILRNQLV